ncbi:MAG: hypothetical protein R1F52_03810 [Candidatus Nitrosoabyssus spongiisocia]|nr:MAG: hypothetical protein R1F52_03810 [Nitrosopumilaceae archaeon AB1(1)]
MLTINESIILQYIKKATDNSRVNKRGVLGKKALQKCMYFFNLNENYFYFKWADYGPFSKELQNIAGFLIDSEKINVEKEKTGKKNAITQILTFKDETKIYDKLPENVNAKIDEIIKFSSGLNPRELELLASVHFWAEREQGYLEKYTSEYILEKLTDLKPDAGFKKDDVEWAIEKLEDNGFLAKNDDNSQN